MSQDADRKPEDDRAAARQERPDGDKTNPENGKSKISERLDEALEETFPSSDPVSVKVTK